MNKISSQWSKYDVVVKPSSLHINLWLNIIHALVKHVSIYILTGGQADPGNSDRENVCLSESPPCHEHSLSESPPKRSIFLLFVMLEWCNKEWLLSETLYGRINPCHNPAGYWWSRTLLDMNISNWFVLWLVLRVGEHVWFKCDYLVMKLSSGGVDQNLGSQVSGQ